MCYIVNMSYIYSILVKWKEYLDMKQNLLKYFVKLTDMLAASAFAELGELETAREIILCSLPHGGYPKHPDDRQYGENDLCYSKA